MVCAARRLLGATLLLSVVITLGGCGSGNSSSPSGSSPSSSSTGVGSGSQSQAHFLYSGTLNTAEVYGFETSTSNSQLTVVSGSPFPSNGTRVGSILAADPQLRLLFVVNQGNRFVPTENITTFHVDVNSGSLNPVSTLDTTGLDVMSLAVSPSGNYLYAATEPVLACCSAVQGQIRIFSIGAAGTLKQVASIDQPFGLSSAFTALTIDPTGAFLYAAAGWRSGDLFHDGIAVIAYAITNADSGLSLLATYPELDAIPSNTAASGIFANSNYLYASAALGQTLYVFQRHADGTLARLASPSTPFINPMGIAATPDGQFVYLADGSNARVLAFSVASDGALTQIDTFSVGSLATNFAEDVIVAPSGNTLYVSGGRGEVFALSIGADGHLTEAAGSPYFTVDQAASNTIVLF